MPPRFMVVAGEASGDLHAAAAVRALKSRVPDAEVFGMGGHHLQAAGVELLYEASEIAAMGITEVLGKLPRLLGVLGGLERAARDRKPAAALLVDVPDFNLRLAKRLKKLGIPVLYYVSPMVWAWREGRCKALARDVREVLCIYPFEEPFLRERGVNARYVGNPLMDEWVEPVPAAPSTDGALRLALLPGSRPTEVARMLQPMLKAVKLLARSRPVEVAIPVAPTVERDVLQAGLDHAGVAGRLVDETAEALRWSQVALVKSGTATLEACLAERPMVVIYKVSAGSAWVGRRMLRVKHASLVNLLAERALVPELLQEAATPEAVAKALEDVLGRGDELIQGYRAVRAKLGGPGAAAKVAEALLDTLSPSER
jgi:lipid-A-disaccharide synthase